MKSTTFSFVAQVQQHPATLRHDSIRSEQMRLTAGDKSELEKMVEVELRRGWALLSRSFSLDDGHGATLIRREISKAA